MDRGLLPAKRARPVAGGGGSEVTGTPGTRKPINSPRRGDGNRPRTTEAPTACFLFTALQCKGGNAASLAHPVRGRLRLLCVVTYPHPPRPHGTRARRVRRPAGAPPYCSRPGVPLTAFASPPATRRARSAGKSTTETAGTPLAGLLYGLLAGRARIGYLSARRINATGSSGCSSWRRGGCLVVTAAPGLTTPPRRSTGSPRCPGSPARRRDPGNRCLSRDRPSRQRRTPHRRLTLPCACAREPPHRHPGPAPLSRAGDRCAKREQNPSKPCQTVREPPDANLKRHRRRFVVARTAAATHSPAPAKRTVPIVAPRRARHRRTPKAAKRPCHSSAH